MPPPNRCRRRFGRTVGVLRGIFAKQVLQTPDQARQDMPSAFQAGVVSAFGARF